ncbi:hypothetical protein EV426DRAFT_721064 [Tirmania nivea]|nr:hypothetical protein EV426DRAFT_721064 [Tirmania nivea]
MAIVEGIGSDVYYGLSLKNETYAYIYLHLLHVETIVQAVPTVLIAGVPPVVVLHFETAVPPVLFYHCETAAPPVVVLHFETAAPPVLFHHSETAAPPVVILHFETAAPPVLFHHSETVLPEPALPVVYSITLRVSSR